MSMEYVRKYYGVPAHRGGRVIYTGDKIPKFGTITSSTRGRINVRFDGDSNVCHLHPTWEVEYQEGSRNSKNGK